MPSDVENFLNRILDTPIVDTSSARGLSESLKTSDKALKARQKFEKRRREINDSNKNVQAVFGVGEAILKATVQAKAQYEAESGSAILEDQFVTAGSSMAKLSPPLRMTALNQMASRDVDTDLFKSKNSQVFTNYPK